MDKSQYQHYSPKGKNPRGYRAEFHQGGWTYTPFDPTPAWVKELGAILRYFIFVLLIVVAMLIIMVNWSAF